LISTNNHHDLQSLKKSQFLFFSHTQKELGLYNRPKKNADLCKALRVYEPPELCDTKHSRSTSGNSKMPYLWVGSAPRSTLEYFKVVRNCNGRKTEVDLGWVLIWYFSNRKTLPPHHIPFISATHLPFSKRAFWAIMS
jgi:hypothetical protein